jgi:hypothetical protein
MPLSYVTSGFSRAIELITLDKPFPCRKSHVSLIVQPVLAN